MSQKRIDWYVKAKEKFLTNHPINLKEIYNKKKTDTCEAITYWVKYKSWTYCGRCDMLHKQKMLPNYGNISAKQSFECPCRAETYLVPQIDAFPPDLRGLTLEDQSILSLYEIDSGPYKVEK